MLDLFQNFSKSWLSKIILFLIIIVFAFLGVGNLKFFSINVLASVNGEDIYLPDYRQFYDQMSTERSQSGQEFSKEERAQMRVNALDIMINQIIYQQEARRYGFRVTDEEIAESISNIPDFQTSERFDQRKYFAALERIGSTPAQFEKRRKKAFLISKLDQMFRSTLGVSEYEIDYFFNLLNKQHRVELMELSPTLFQDTVEVSEDQIKESYEANKEKLLSPFVYNINYVRLTAQDFLRKSTVKNNEVLGYYEKNKETEFLEKPGFLSKHILVAFEDDGEAAQTTALNKAQKIFQEVKKNESQFSIIAEKQSDDPFSAKKQGSLGWIENGQFVSEYEEAIAKMQKGEISQPIKSIFGYHIIQLNDIRTEEKTIELTDSLKKEIKEKLELEKSQLRLDNFVLRNEGKIANQTLQEVAQSSKKEIQTINKFNGIDETIQNSQQLYATLKNQLKNINRIYKSGEDYLVYQVKSTEGGTLLNYEEAKDTLKSQLVDSLSRIRLQKEVKTIKKTIKTKDDFDAFVEKHKQADNIYKVQFSLTDGDDTVLLPSDFKNKIAQIKKNESVTVINHDKRIYLAYKAKPNDVTSDRDIEEVKKRLKSRLSEERYNVILQKLIQSLRQNAKITYHPDELRAVQIEL